MNDETRADSIWWGEGETLENILSQAIGHAEYAWVPMDTGNYNTSRLAFLKNLGKAAHDAVILWLTTPDAAEHIDRMLAERHGETTVPDAERVERAADAIHDVDRKRFPDVVRHIPSRTVYLDRARAALAAAGPEAHPDLTTAYMAGLAKGEDWLDEGLDSVPGCIGVTVEKLNRSGRSTDMWGATIVTSDIEQQSTPESSPTAAVLNAIAAAVKDATGVEIPQPEEEKWHVWDLLGDKRWDMPDRGYQEADGIAAITPYYLRVWATTADRDAKRDRLLAAAREAGKP